MWLPSERAGLLLADHLRRSIYHGFLCQGSTAELELKLESSSSSVQASFSPLTVLLSLQTGQVSWYRNCITRLLPSVTAFAEFHGSRKCPTSIERHNPITIGSEHQLHEPMLAGEPDGGCVIVS